MADLIPPSPAPSHEEIKAFWQPGQIWETKVHGSTGWVLVGDDGKAEPLWDFKRQDYRPRRVADPLLQARDRIPDDLFRAIGELSMALGNPAVSFGGTTIEAALVRYAAKWVREVKAQREV